jgi:hypothetical protein
MSRRRQQPCFMKRPHKRIVVVSLSQMRMEHLERQLAAQLFVERPIHRPRPSRAQLLEQRIATTRLHRHRRQNCSLHHTQHRALRV